jgi:Rrf2 family protein
VVSHDIARDCGMPPGFVPRVLKRLATAGLLRTARRPTGGYRLGRPAGAITLLEIVEAVDGPLRGPAAAADTVQADQRDRRLAAADLETRPPWYWAGFSCHGRLR